MGGLDWETWKDRTITCNCLSKTFAMTGWRIGYAAGPKGMIDGMGKLQSQMTSNITELSHAGDRGGVYERGIGGRGGEDAGGV